MERPKCVISTACYLIENEEVLLLKFNKKWGQVYAPPGGKAQEKESPLDCILREYQEETGLTLIHPKLKGYAYWNYINQEYGIIFFYVASEYSGSIKESAEGKLLKIPIQDMKNIEQFDMNSKFVDLIFEDCIFEGNFELDQDHRVKNYTLTEI